MTIVTDLKNIDGHFFSTLIVLFLSIVCPGVLTLYLFLPELFISLDGLKFMLFSVALSLPLFVLNSVFSGMVISAETDEEEDHNFQYNGLVSGAISSLIAYMCLMLSYVFSFSFSGFLVSLCVAELLYISVCSIVLFKAYQKFKANS